MAKIQTMTHVSARALFLAFIRLGLTAFGGPAMIPYIRRMAVSRKNWLTDNDFRLGIATAQSVPGATAMQVAAYVGLRAGGLRGALAAYAGFGLPAFAMMCALSGLYFSSGQIPALAAAFAGLKILVTAMVLNASLEFSLRFLDRRLDQILALGAGSVMALHGNPILAILGVVLIGVLAYRDVPGAPPPSVRGNSAAPPLPPRSPLKRTVALIAAAGLGLGLLYFVDSRLFDLGALMMKIDLFAFGGGYVSIPLMLHEVVVSQHWMTEGQFMDGIALGQVTPGPIVMTAAFAGWAVSGFTGALVGAAAAFTPSFIILTTVVPIYRRLAASSLFQRALRASVASLAGLMTAVAGRFLLAVDWNLPAILLGLAAFTALRLKIDILWVVLAGAVVSALIF